ncbi:MAG: 50S ribosomal protein L25/general stress protein Ctc [Prevotellaceae bacterium]|jgi:large subunit ribosomal protein L25|nr:50S ribosomal protein L25/general stress protein Ctc [Prevotellaceae bacterium]
MKTIKLNGQSRTNLGKKGSKELRKKDLVPCILYGNKAENQNFILVEKELKDLIYTPFSYIVEVNIDGKIETCILQDIQFHPVTDKILHIDFLNVDENKPVAIEIPVKITGHSEGVKQGGKLQVLSRKIKVSALLNDLPDEIPVDITNLQLGKSICVGDLSLDKLNIITPKSNIICSVKMTRAAMGAAATAEEQQK